MYYINRYFSLILKITCKQSFSILCYISEKYSLETIRALKEGSKEDRGGENSCVTPFRMSRRLRLSSRRFSLFHFRSPDFKADSKVERGFKGLVYTLDRSGARIPSLEFYDRVCRETIVPFSTFLSFWRFVFLRSFFERPFTLHALSFLVLLFFSVCRSCLLIVQPRKGWGIVSW